MRTSTQKHHIRRQKKGNQSEIDATKLGHFII